MKKQLKTEMEEEWIGSGPFSIDKAQYNVGEKIFIDVDGLKLEKIKERH